MTLEQREVATTEPIVDEEFEVGIMDLDENTRLMIGVKEITLRAHAGSKVSIAQFETTDMSAGMDITYDLTAFKGSLPVDKIINDIVVPLRNSTVKMTHADTMARTEEMRAITEGIRDGKQLSTIADEVSRTRRGFLSLFKKVFEAKK
jgi:hypothetical protein